MSESKRWTKRTDGNRRGDEKRAARPQPHSSENNRMNAREAAYAILEPFFTKGADLDSQVDRVFKSNIISEKDRRLAYEISMGVLRFQSTLDYTIMKYLSEKFHENDAVKIAIRIGLYQLLYLDRVPPHAAVSESVNLMKRFADYGLSKVVNGVLRSIEKDGKKALKVGDDLSASEKMTVEFSHPQWILDRWIANFGMAKTKKLVKFNCSKPDIYVRRNSLAVSQLLFESSIAEATETKPQAQGFEKRYYKLKQGVRPESVSAFQSGFCTVQAPSSGWVVALLDLKKGDTVIDLCSAPGGKTTLAAEMVGESGMVVAADISVTRLSSLMENVIRLGLRGVYPVVSDSTRSSITGLYDKVLLDAPCSGTGVIHRHPDARFRKGEDDIIRCSQLQKRAIKEAASLVAPGGVLVYSTCSLEPEENQQQVEAFIDENPEFELSSADDFVDSRFCMRKGYLFVTPHDHGMDGIFAARLVRKKV